MRTKESIFMSHGVCFTIRRCSTSCMVSTWQFPITKNLMTVIIIIGSLKVEILNVVLLLPNVNLYICANKVLLTFTTLDNFNAWEIVKLRASMTATPTWSTWSVYKIIHMYYLLRYIPIWIARKGKEMKKKKRKERNSACSDLFDINLTFCKV